MELSESEYRAIKKSCEKCKRNMNDVHICTIDGCKNWPITVSEGILGNRPCIFFRGELKLKDITENRNDDCKFEAKEVRKSVRNLEKLHSRNSEW